MANNKQAPVEGGRQVWASQTGFILAAIGSAIGLGNIWRFPGVAYTNGGGAFLVPYLVALLFAGIPILFLDYAIGHRYRGSAPLALRRMNKKFEWVGWWQVLISFIIMIYYAVIIGWAIMFIYYSVGEQWGEDTPGFFAGSFLHLPDVESQAFSLQPVWHILIPVAIVWLAIIFIISRGVSHGIERANKVFIPLLVVIFVIMVGRALFLPGALDGLNQFFTPNWGALADYKVWLAAFSQIFFSLSVAFGIMLTYASYLPKNSNLTGTGLVAGFANSSFEILAGIGVFATLGFMAAQQGMTIAEYGENAGLTGVGLAFMTFPAIISQMPGGSLFGVLFFASLVLAGITSLLSLMQVVTGAMEDKFGWSTARSSWIVGIVSMLFSVLFFAATTGLNILDIVDNFINNIGVVSSAVMMTLAVSLVARNTGTLRRHLNKYSTVKMPKAWEWLVGYILPIVLLFMMATTAIDLVKNGYGGYPNWLVTVFGWGSIVLGLVVAAVFTAMKWKTIPDGFDAELEHALDEGQVK